MENDDIPQELFGNEIADDLSSDSSLEDDREAFSRRKQSTIYWRRHVRPIHDLSVNACIVRCSVATTLLKTTVDAHRKRLIEGEEARKGLKEWSERVLHGLSDDDLRDAGVFDIDQLDIDLESGRRLTHRGEDGVGAQLMTYWYRTIDERVAERLKQVVTQIISCR